MTQVLKAEGEPTKFFVEGNSLECVKCHKQFPRVPTTAESVPGAVLATLRMLRGWLPGSRSLDGLKIELDRMFNRNLYRKAGRVGDQCPKCDGKLDLQFYAVELTDYNRNGSCTCMFFTCSLAKQVRAVPPEEQGLGRHRCSHIYAARDFALDVALYAHTEFRKENTYEGP